MPAEYSDSAVANPVTAEADTEVGAGPHRDSSTAAVEDEIRRIGLPLLSVLAFVVGIVGEFGPVVFRDLIGLVYDLLFLANSPRATTPTSLRRPVDGVLW